MTVQGVVAAVKATAAVNDLVNEYKSATNKHKAFNSAHEGWAVIMEEVDELWEEIRKKRSARDRKRMREEAIQIAAMALRFAVDVCE